MTDRPGDNPNEVGRRSNDGAFSAALASALSRARLALLWERLWPAVVSLAVVIGLFFALSWAGLWLVLPPIARAVVLAMLAGLAAISTIPLLRVRRPSAEDSLRRLDRTSGLTHRPATAIADGIATAKDDQVSLALWRAHVERALAALDHLKAGWPAPRLAARDPFALRALVLFLVVVTFIAAGGDRIRRVAAAFDWSGAVPSANFRVDAWVTPPTYTGKPPIILPGLHAGEASQAVASAVQVVPAGSVLVVRATGLPRFDVAVTGGLDANTDVQSGVAPPAGTEQRQFVIHDHGSAKLRGAFTDVGWNFQAIPDRAPTIELAKDPELQNRGSLRLTYRLEDDYGVVGAQAAFARKETTGHDGKAARLLYGPPDFPLVLPQARTRNGVGETIKNLTEHPWAGTDVMMTLTARDEAGNEGHSAPYELTLPERPFSKPLAKALVEQRRILALDAEARKRVLTALDALAIAPEHFTPEAGIYLGLRAIYWQLDRAKSDDDLREVVAQLWSMAIGIEGGDVSDAEQALRSAEDALRQALERGAGDEEIKRLTEQLRAALDKFMQALAEQLRRNPQQFSGPLDPHTRVVRPQDLKNMLDRIERLARSGAKDAARQLLEDMQSMLENLQTAQPNATPEGDDDMMSALDELGNIIREQQQLRDRTFRQGQDERGDRQQGQQGLDNNNQNGDGLGDLQQNQQALREQLDKMLEELRKNGQSGEPGQNGNEALGRAEGAMRDAEGALGQGKADGAVDAQGRALEALRKGAQNLAQQMQQGQGAPGMAPGRSGPARAQQDTDPLGRPLRGRDYGDDASVKVPGEIDTQRARRVLEELRRRFSDPQRPQIELDYIERLLRGF